MESGTGKWKLAREHFLQEKFDKSSKSNEI